MYPEGVCGLAQSVLKTQRNLIIWVWGNKASRDRFSGKKMVAKSIFGECPNKTIVEG